MAKLFRKGKAKRIVAIVLGLVSIVGAVFGVSALAKYAKDKQKTISPVFSVGGLTETGVYEETDDTIYTKDSFEAKGLEVKLDFDSNVKYQVFFYDELDKFVSCTDVYAESAKISVPLECSARMEITPIWGPDAPLEKEIKWYETVKYASQVEIRVDKNQELLESDFTAYKLTDTKYFTKHEGKIFSVEEANLIDAVGNCCFSMKLSDMYNYMYLRSDNVDAFENAGVTVVFVSEEGSVRGSDFFMSNRMNMNHMTKINAFETIYIYSATDLDYDALSLMLCFI